LNSIDGEKYLANLMTTAEKKIKVLTEKDPIKKKYKLITYLQTKGFEKDLIFDVLKANNLTD
jgi:regulatory protein